MTAAMPATKFRKVGVSLNGKHIRMVNAFARARGIHGFSPALQVIIHEHAQLSAPASPSPATPAAAPAPVLAEVPAGSPAGGDQPAPSTTA